MSCRHRWAFLGSLSITASAVDHHSSLWKPHADSHENNLGHSSIHHSPSPKMCTWHLFLDQFWSKPKIDTKRLKPNPGSALCMLRFRQSLPGGSWVGQGCEGVSGQVACLCESKQACTGSLALLFWASMARSGSSAASDIMTLRRARVAYATKAWP